MRGILENWSLWHSLIGGVVTLVLVVVFLTFWLMFGAGPRRRRALKQAKHLLAAGKWREVNEFLPSARAIGSPSAAQQKTFDQIEGQALEIGAAEALADHDYENALNLGLQAARLLDANPLEKRADVQNALLDEARRLFATGPIDDPAPILDLLHRAIRVQSPCKEASFWQAMCLLRAGDNEQAMSHLHVARTGMERGPRDEDDDGRGPPPSPILEPSLYLGALLLKQGKPKEALRYFTEANRLDASCAIVPLNLGCGIIAAGGDAALGVRTLQKALGPRGVGAWESRPTSFWAEVYPENRSYIRKLAIKHPFTCPIWGDTPAILVGQAKLALAQGLERLGQHQEAAELFDQVMKTSSPSLPLLRGQGLSLARLGRYADAYKPLRMAHELEDPKDQWTSGYLALCAAKAATKEDAAANAAWAVKTVTPFSAPGNAEWVKLLGEIFAAARAEQATLSLDDQLYLCEHLTSVHTVDERSAAALRQIYDEHPQCARPEYAWLYAQSVTTLGGIEHASPAVFEAALADRPAAEAFFKDRGWNLEAIERAYLMWCARFRPGVIPAVFGEDGAERARRLLLEGSRAAEEAGELDEARALVEAFSRLVPHNPAALDRLAALHFRAGKLAQAIAALMHWQQRAPEDPLPLARLALVRATAGEVNEGLDLLTMAFDIAQGKARTEICLLASRLALHHWATTSDPSAKDWALGRAREALDRADPANAEAIATLAAWCWIKNDEAGLVALADRVRIMAGGDPRHFYFGALALSAAKDWTGVVAACRRATHLIGDKNGPLTTLLAEVAYLEGIAHAELGDAAAAIERLEKPAAATGPSTHFAQGLLGSLLFQQGRFDDATEWWQKLPAGERTAWKIGEALGGAQMLAALEAFHAGRFELAADKFRQAGKLGCRDRRLGGLMLASLVKAGQQAVYGDSE